MQEKIIGERISSLLSEKCKTQKDLAAALGVYPNVISYWCNSARTPNVEQITIIAKYFGVTTDYLLGMTDIETQDRNVQSICSAVGLSEQSANNLIRAMKSEKLGENKEALVINAVLSNWGCLYSLTTTLLGLMGECEQAQDYIKEKNVYDSDLARDYQTGKVIDRMELSFFKADEAFRDVINKTFGYRKIIDGLKSL